MSEETEKVSTKVCGCGSRSLIKLESQNLKHCNDCQASIAWPLEEGQEPLNGSSRAGRKGRDR